MSKDTDPIVIKKYANRRLYNTGTSAYVTLEDLALMVKAGEDFVVQDAKSGEDLTRSVLTQIIFEQEGKDGQNLLPISFLRQLIGYYGGSMQTLVPSYLEFSMDSFAKKQGEMQEQMAKMMGGSGLPNMQIPGMGAGMDLSVIEEQVQQNAEMFQKAMGMFNPFAGGTQDGKPDAPAPSEKPSADELQTLKQQLAAMQEKMDKLS
ncbi:MAG: polyhydroxyalkanoate synthesis repressor PhaR [Rhizobiaceae bacterium]|nr:polyhydroxyalkanoate synthesis repressor PhaR [Rhizobiaceae bacterium]